MDDSIGYLTYAFLIVAATPFLFWIVSLLYAWVKWLFKGKKELNESYTEMSEFNNPISEEFTFSYLLGTDGEVKFALIDTSFNEIKTLEKNTLERGRHKFVLDTSLFSNGKYFLKLITNNQEITKQIIIENNS